jgi:ATP-dependent Clp protease ATP-binding subunit ClpA
VNRLLDARRLAPLLVVWELTPDVLGQFQVEATRDGAKFIEAEHMLLALAASPKTDAAKLLGEFGLDHPRLVSALEEEHRRTLTFAGMREPGPRLVKATELDTKLSLGTSAKAAIRRGLIGARHDRRRARLRSIELLAGILQAELGRVPRALAIAGIDRAALIARARVFE